MTEEEKKAIAYLKFYISDNQEYFDKDFVIDKNILKTAINIIQKQNTEINKLKEEKEELEQRLQEIELQILEENI